MSDSATPWTIAHQAPWDSPCKNIGVGYHSLLQGISPTQGLNPGLLHCRRILDRLSHQGSPLAGRSSKPKVLKMASSFQVTQFMFQAVEVILAARHVSSCLSWPLGSGASCGSLPAFVWIYGRLCFWYYLFSETLSIF